jgi:MFS family permease
MNGGSAGGIVIVPLLVLSISRLGFTVGLNAVSALLLAVLIPVVMLLLRPKRDEEHDPADLCAASTEPPPCAATSANESAAFRLGAILRSRAFITTSVPFALALTAQVGLLTHQVAFLSPIIGTIAAGWAVSLTTFAAVAGRIATGFVVDRFNRRAVASFNFATQAFGIGILASATEGSMLYLGCLLFGAGVGNTASLPGLIVQQEFPKQHFARTISLVVAINQFSFAFGPTLLAQLQRAGDSYTAALLACLAAEIVAAIVVLSPDIVRRWATA